MQELAPTSPRVGLVLQYLQERPTPLRGRNYTQCQNPILEKASLERLFGLDPYTMGVPCCRDPQDRRTATNVDSGRSDAGTLRITPQLFFV